MAAFQASLAEFEKAGAQVLGSSVDSRFVQGAFAEKLGVTFPLVSDFPRYRSTRGFEAYQEEHGWTARVTFVIDRQGIIRQVIEDEENMTRHAKEALEAVRAIAAEEG